MSFINYSARNNIDNIESLLLINFSSLEELNIGNFVILTLENNCISRINCLSKLSNLSINHNSHLQTVYT